MYKREEWRPEGGEGVKDEGGVYEGQNIAVLVYLKEKEPADFLVR